MSDRPFFKSGLWMFNVLDGMMLATSDAPRIAPDKQASALPPNIIIFGPFGHWVHADSSM